MSNAASSTSNTTVKPLTRGEIAYLVANDFPDGSVVNLGIGMPTQVADYLPEDREILLHSENGILGMGRASVGDEIDLDIINASRTPVTLLAGASIQLDAHQHLNTLQYPLPKF